MAGVGCNSKISNSLAIAIRVNQLSEIEGITRTAKERFGFIVFECEDPKRLLSLLIICQENETADNKQNVCLDEGENTEVKLY